MTPRLSKSRIQSGRQCHKRLWLELHQSDASNWGGAAQARMDEGTRFGELAQLLLGGGLLIEADHQHVREALAETAAALARPPAEVPMLFEAGFSHEDVRVRVDAFQRGDDGDTLIEVKSTTKVKDEHIWDCAIQTWVARGAGRNVTKIILAHVDNRFVYTTPGDYTGLLALVDITREVNALQPAIPALVAQLKEVAAGSMPELATGAHCSSPYGCPFLGHCQSLEPALPDYPIDCLPRAGAVLERLRLAGYRDLREVPDESLTNPTHKRVAAATRAGRPYVSPEFPGILAEIAYPRHYLDFETASFVIPRWLGTRPFQSLPFQFSCHRQSDSGDITHSDFLDMTGESPLEAFVEAVLDAVGKDGPILVWNQGFEAGRLRELASRFPKRRRALNRVIARMVDLLPLYRSHYYHRDMRGSWSIKAVLPTVAPDLAYDDLEIAGGMDAQYAYLEAIRPETSAERREQVRSHLRKYCERDTFAMVRLTALGTSAPMHAETASIG